MICGLILLAIVVGCSGSKKTNSEAPENTTQKQEQKYLPPELQHLYFGMPFKAFFNIYKNISVSELMEFRKEVSIGNFTPDIKELTIYFDNEGEFPLYEFIIDYKDVQLRDDIVEAIYGKPNMDNGEWKFDSKKGYPIRVWTFENKIVIAAFMEGTEWEGEE